MRMQQASTTSHHAHKVHEHISYYYTLSFSYTYHYENDTVYIAQCVPYTYMDLVQDLHKLNKRVEYKEHFRLSSLCKTVGGNICPSITITHNIGTYLPTELEQLLVARSASARKILHNKMLKLRRRLIMRKSALERKKTRIVGSNTNNRGITKKCNNKKKEVRDSFVLDGGEVEPKSWTGEEKLYELVEHEFEETHPLEVAMLRHYEEHRHKKAIIITARVHPGIYIYIYIN